MQPGQLSPILHTQEGYRILKMISKKPADRLSNMHEFVAKFARMRVYKTDPDPAAARDAGSF